MVPFHDSSWWTFKTNWYAKWFFLKHLCKVFLHSLVLWALLYSNIYLSCWVVLFCFDKVVQIFMFYVYVSCDCLYLSFVVKLEHCFIIDHKKVYFFYFQELQIGLFWKSFRISIDFAKGFKWTLYKIFCALKKKIFQYLQLLTMIAIAFLL